MSKQGIYNEHGEPIGYEFIYDDRPDPDEYEDLDYHDDDEWCEWCGEALDDTGQCNDRCNDEAPLGEEQ